MGIEYSLTKALPYHHKLYQLGMVRCMNGRRCVLLDDEINKVKYHYYIVYDTNKIITLTYLWGQGTSKPSIPYTLNQLGVDGTRDQGSSHTIH